MREPWSFEDIFEGYRLHDRDLRLARACYSRAYETAKGEKRKTGPEALCHYTDVARQLSDRFCDVYTVCAGLLHDCPEDSAERRCKADKTLSEPKEIDKELDSIATYLSKELGPSAGESIDRTLAITSMLQNRYDTYLDYVYNLPNGKDAWVIDRGFAVKGCDTTCNMVDIGNQDLWLSSSNLRQDIQNIRYRLERKVGELGQTMKHMNMEDYIQSFTHGVRGAIELGLGGLATLGKEVQQGTLRRYLKSLPDHIQEEASHWLSQPGFSGPDINRRAFKNAAFNEVYKSYLEGKGILTNRPKDYDWRDNLFFFFRRGCLIAHNEMMGLRARIEGVSRRPGNKELRNQLRLLQWQLGYEQIVLDTMHLRTEKGHAHDPHVKKYPIIPSTMIMTEIGTEEELETRYKLFYSMRRLRPDIQDAYHGVITFHKDSLTDKKLLKTIDGKLAHQYAHAVSFMELFSYLRFEHKYRIPKLFEKNTQESTDTLKVP